MPSKGVVLNKELRHWMANESAVNGLLFSVIKRMLAVLSAKGRGLKCLYSM